MNKGEIVKQIAVITNVSETQTNKFLQAFIDIVENELKSGGNVSITGFGSFQVKYRAARTGRNMKTGEAVSIDAVNIPAFKPGKRFRQAVL